MMAMDAGGFLCMWCTRVTGATENGMLCEAYPDGIPMVILDGADHRALRGDETVPVAFTAKPGTERFLGRWEALHVPHGNLLPLPTDVERILQKYNHNHGEHGHFASSDSGFSQDAAAGGGATSDWATIPPKYRAAANARLDALGVSPRTMEARLDRILDRANADHAPWYVHAATAAANMGAKYGVTQSASAGVIAAISPAREFGKNMRDADLILSVTTGHEPFTPTAESLASYKGDRSKLPKFPATPDQCTARQLATLHPRFAHKLGNITGYANAENAIEIARGGDPDKYLGGPKVRSFYSNLVAPGAGHVTIDTWMYRAMIGPRHRFPATAGKAAGRTMAEVEAGIGGKSARTQDLFQGSPGGLKGSGIPDGVGTYPVFADVVRRVAAKRGLTPDAVQAMVWEVARGDAGYKPTDLQATLGPWL